MEWVFNGYNIICCCLAYNSSRPPPPVPAGLLDYRLTTDGLGTPWVDKVKKKPAGILDTDPLDTTNQTGYRKSERFNNLMANMLVDYGANKLGKDDDWLWRETMR